MNRILSGFSVLLVAALVAACGDGGGGDQNSSDSAGSAGTAGASGSGGSTGGSSAGSAGSSAGGSSTGGSGGSSTGGSGGSSTGGSAGSSGGTACGGFVGAQCAANEFCDYPDDMCGAADGQGTCTVRPDVCPDNIDPVCACDGKIYNNLCESHVAGSDAGVLGGCQAPAGQFACGSQFCAKGQQYCQVEISDVAGIPNSYSCEPLPAACSQQGATCDCFTNEPCADMCKAADGGFTLTCPGG